jgi:hypothetical protein
MKDKSCGKINLRKLASSAIHKGIPSLASSLGGIGAELLAPELGPVSAFAGSRLGEHLGKKIATLVGNKTGLGLIQHLHHHIVSSARTRGKDLREMGENITEHNIIHPILHLATKGLHKTITGKGFFDKLKKYTGIAWSHLAPIAKKAGKEALKIGADTLGKAVSAYTGNPAFGDASSALASSLGETALDTIEEPKKTSISKQKAIVKKVVKDAIKVAEDEIQPFEIPIKKSGFRGRGIVHKRHRGHHPIIEGGDIADRTAPTQSQITYVGGNNEFNTPVQLGSPYQYTYSPAMNPYFENVNQLQGYNPISSGSVVGGMVVHHIHHSTMGAISKPKRGGSFMPAGTRGL